MSISGAFLVLFLLFHMCMNLVAVFSTDAYNMVCEFLGANWYALAATLVLAAGFAVHIIYALVLTWQNYRARGGQRYANLKTPGVEWAAKNMFVLGAIVAGGLLLHLYNFWYKMQFVEIVYSHEQIVSMGLEPTNGAKLISELFAQPVYAAIYLVWLFALWFHLTHGFWSAMQTVGFNSKVWMCRLKVISYIFATVVCLGFATVVVFFFIKGL